MSIGISRVYVFCIHVGAPVRSLGEASVSLLVQLLEVREVQSNFGVLIHMDIELVTIPLRLRF